MSCCERFKNAVVSGDIEFREDGELGPGYYIPTYDIDYEVNGIYYRHKVEYCPFCGMKK